MLLNIRSTWIFNMIRQGNKAHFVEVNFNRSVGYLAGNRAARRLLKSNRVINEAKKRGSIIADETIF